MFLDANGEKISKSSGNGVSIDEWLTYASAESLSYFMFLKPKPRPTWTCPKAVDEYHQQLRASNAKLKAQLNPVWHIHNGDVPNLLWLFHSSY